MNASALLAFGLVFAVPARAADDDLQNLLDSIPDIETAQDEVDDTEAEPDVPFITYAEQVQARILAAWKPSRGIIRKNPSIVTRLVVSIDRSGNVTGIKALQLSGDKKYDKKAVDAINDAGTLPPPPANLVDLAAEGVIVEFSGKDWLRTH